MPFWDKLPVNIDHLYSRGVYRVFFPLRLFSVPVKKAKKQQGHIPNLPLYCPHFLGYQNIY